MSGERSSTEPLNSSLLSALRRAVLIVALLNLAYFGVEFAVALRIGSVSLFADSADFFEDAAVNFLIVAALGWSAARRARVGMLLSAILLAPAIAFLWTLWHKLSAPLPPDAIALSATGLGALLVNLIAAFLLARHRRRGGSLAKAAWLSARNDALANVAIIVAGLVTLRVHSPWPDIIVGIGIAIMNLDAAREVWMAAREEHLLSQAEP
ncbi:MAG: cation transporter [Pseudomonadota bacterium]|jgi:Co/Zn/Cd efflux system component|uniref:cation transporter n=1 Tax=unclassified Sphingomonas TaxID=196159 RepID=UPI00087203A6|nr:MULTISPECIES: cation transporter [unclassified Sphingomonas]OJY51730.1 MAG: cobalt transporter [Sphingomonas sp. 67-41]VVT17979.1 Cobalt transporter [Sphingomonas sp. EC-HK361]|tara:strand:+ start:5551 stop:6180 length:630 start_codon:yes stop_codon:yes gene_type:complete